MPVQRTKRRQEDVLVLLNEARIRTAENEVPASERDVDVFELTSQHAADPPHELHLRRHLTCVDKLVPQLRVLRLEYLMVDSITFLEQIGLSFFLLVRGFELLLQFLVNRELAHPRRLFLHVGRWVHLGLQLVLELLNVLGDLIEILDAERHDAVEHPVSVGPGLRLTEYELNSLLV